ncbi:acylphosphatase [Treponema sp.]|uniref:acylphosphatase n=1 Tax=Treponema sp. TaxID=166 RepID=UPI00388D1A24
MSEKIRKHVIFSGRVQGVGFRWHSKNYARSVGLTGWVQNLYDGTVEMEVQGTEEKIDGLIAYMGRRTYVEIENIDAKTIPLEPHEMDFVEKGW